MDGRWLMREIKRMRAEEEALRLGQPPPQSGREDVTPALIEKLRERARAGLATYGTPLQTHNGRDALADALDEAIDLCQYLMQAIMERDGEQR